MLNSSMLTMPIFGPGIQGYETHLPTHWVLNTAVEGGITLLRGVCSSVRYVDTEECWN